MISCNNNNLCSKCYITFCNIVPQGMGSFNMLAIAINGVNGVLIKKILKFTCFHSQNLELTP